MTTSEYAGYITGGEITVVRGSVLTSGVTKDPYPKKTARNAAYKLVQNWLEKSKILEKRFADFKKAKVKNMIV